MDTIVSAIYADAGCPPMEGEQIGVCVTCGCADTVGLLFADWVRPTFTDHDKLHDGSIVCHACQFSFTDRNLELARRLGKPGVQRMRNYSHFILGGRWIPVSKADKSRMAELLLDGTETAAVAIGGQKHILFRCPSGWWQVEELTVRPDVALLQSLLGDIERLYTTFSKAEIETGRYAQHRIRAFGLEVWQVIESRLRWQRETPMFELALFLAQKKEGTVGQADAEPRRSGPKTTLFDMAGDSRRL